VHVANKTAIEGTVAATWFKGNSLVPSFLMTPLFCGTGQAAVIDFYSQADRQFQPASLWRAAFDDAGKIGWRPSTHSLVQQHRFFAQKTQTRVVGIAHFKSAPAVQLIPLDGLHFLFTKTESTTVKMLSV
jgi:hypothetical protein